MAFKNEIGNEYGFWKVIKKAEGIKKKSSVPAKWLCRCKCGNEKIIDGDILRDGSSKSCGCWRSFENGLERALTEKIRPGLNGCIEWTGRRDRDGYARYGEKSRIVSRLVYEKHKGEIPEGMCVCHSCDNPGCVNIDHLWIGSNKENNDDKKEKGRCIHGSNHHKSKINEKDVVEIRKLYSEGMFQEDISKLYNVSQTTISGIVLRKFWKHVP